MVDIPVYPIFNINQRELLSTLINVEDDKNLVILECDLLHFGWTKMANFVLTRYGLHIEKTRKELWNRQMTNFSDLSIEDRAKDLSVLKDFLQSLLIERPAYLTRTWRHMGIPEPLTPSINVPMPEFTQFEDLPTLYKLRIKKS